MTDWLQTMLGKKYKADQPRVPAGDPAGGQWTSGGGPLPTIMREGHRAAPGAPVGNHAKDLMSPYMGMASMKKLLRQTQDIPDEHLTGIKRIQTDPPLYRGGFTTDQDAFRDPKGDSAVGLYYHDDGTVVVHPEYADTMVVVHEIGHHVQNMAHQRNNTSLYVAADALKAMHPDKVAGMGLRSYSSTNGEEFLADAYCVWLRGSASQWKRLTDWMQRPGGGKVDLEAIFGKRKA